MNFLAFLALLKVNSTTTSYILSRFYKIMFLKNPWQVQTHNTRYLAYWCSGRLRDPLAQLDQLMSDICVTHVHNCGKDGGRHGRWYVQNILHPSFKPDIIRSDNYLVVCVSIKESKRRRNNLPPRLSAANCQHCSRLSESETGLGSACARSTARSVLQL